MIVKKNIFSVKLLLTVLVVSHFLTLNVFAAAKDTPFITGDVGGSTGTNNGNTYQEVHLGLNLNFTEWLTLRNNGFKRTGSNIKEVTGLDSTLRLVLRGKFDRGSANLFVGSGYRWADESENNAVVTEAGLGAGYGGLGLSGGAKHLKYTKTRLDKSGAELKDEDITYFIGLSGSTSFGK